MRFLAGSLAIVLCCSASVAHGQAAPGRLAQFDLNHDGKLSHDELNRGLAGQFKAAAHGSGGMTLAQFVALREGDAQQRVVKEFRRLDWNGDGKLTFDEYASPQRARFEALDGDGKGAESCAVQAATYQPGNRQRRSFGRDRFCAENDLNHDGTVTHAEFDGVSAKRFTASASGAKTMTEAQFVLATLAHYRDIDARIFGYLDRDRDGKLSLQEFAASDLKLFTRLDKDGDGVLTREEMSYRRYSNQSARQE